MANFLQQGTAILVLLGALSSLNLLELFGLYPQRRRGSRNLFHKSILRKLSFLMAHYHPPIVYIQLSGAATSQQRTHQVRATELCTLAEVQAMLDHSSQERWVITKAMQHVQEDPSVLVTQGGPRASTPYTSGYQEPSDPLGKSKISQLEEELAALRAQVAAIAASTHSAAPTVSDWGGSLMRPDVTLVNAAVPPPPPPPPPPPSLPQFSLKQQVEMNKRNSSPSSKMAATEGRPDLSQVLKGISEVKLKPLPRSPGGTPIPHRTSKPPKSCMDTSDLIAQALKRRFAALQNSPAGVLDTTDPESWETSPDNTPHCNRTTARRALLLEATG